MKQRLAVIVFVVSSLISVASFGDGGWDPGTGPKANNFLTEVACYFQDIWNSLVLQKLKEDSSFVNGGGLRVIGKYVIENGFMSSTGRRD